MKMITILKNSLVRAADECRVGELTDCLTKIMNEEFQKVKRGEVT